MIIENPTEEQLKTLKGIIYCIENKVNGKVYIGQSTNSFNERYTTSWIHHISNDYFGRSIKKYGKQNFSIKILAHSIPIELLDEVEQFCIAVIFDSVFPNGYNFQLGGNNNRAFSKQTLKKMSIAQCKKQYKVKNKNGEIFIIKNGIKNFCDKYNIKTPGFYDMINGKSKQSNGFCLSETDINILKENKLFKIKDKSGKIYEFNNIKNFCKCYSIDSRSLYRVLKGERLSVRGFYLPETDINICARIKNRWKFVILEKDGIEYKVYNVRKFCKENKTSYYSLLYKCIKSNSKKWKNYNIKQICFNDN